MLKKSKDISNIKINNLNFYCINHHYTSYISNSNKIYKLTNLRNKLFIYLNKNSLLKFKQFKS